MTDNENIQFIQERLPIAERLCALAEEATELAQAALKLRRVYDTTSPTIVPYEEALNNLFEEIADVRVCIRCLGLDSDHHVELYREIEASKMERWAKRLKDKA